LKNKSVSKERGSRPQFVVCDQYRRGPAGEEGDTPRFIASLLSPGSLRENMIANTMPEKIFFNQRAYYVWC
jgi:hypothetical protein